jgi:hypothetical protein
MTQISDLDQIVQLGNGIAADIYGQTYDVYRITPKTSGSQIAGAPVIRALTMSLERTTSKRILESSLFDLISYIGTVDNRRLALGDLCVENGYESPGGAYCFAQRRPFVGESIFVRCESPSAIERPYPTAGGVEEQPTSGWTAPADYAAETMEGRMRLVLVNGLYEFVAASDPLAITPASVPIGLAPEKRVRDGHKPALPTTLPRTFFQCYIPPLPGVQIVEHDVIKTLNADQFEVQEIFNTEPVGLVGTFALIEKIAA